MLIISLISFVLLILQGLLDLVFQFMHNIFHLNWIYTKQAVFYLGIFKKNKLLALCYNLFSILHIRSLKLVDDVSPLNYLLTHIENCNLASMSAVDLFRLLQR